MYSDRKQIRSCLEEAGEDVLQVRITEWCKETFKGNEYIYYFAGVAQICILNMCSLYMSTEPR